MQAQNAADGTTGPKRHDLRRRRTSRPQAIPGKPSLPDTRATTWRRYENDMKKPWRPAYRPEPKLPNHRTQQQTTCPLRACEYELADTGRVLGRVLPGLVLVASGDWSVHDSRNLSRAPSASLVIGHATPGQNPSAARSGSSRVRGRGLGRATARSVLWCRAGGGDDARVPRLSVGHDRRRRCEPGHGAEAQGWQLRQDGRIRSRRSIACSVNRFVNRTLR